MKQYIYYSHVCYLHLRMYIFPFAVTATHINYGFLLTQTHLSVHRQFKMLIYNSLINKRFESLSQPVLVNLGVSDDGKIALQWFSVLLDLTL